MGVGVLTKGLQGLPVLPQLIFVLAGVMLLVILGARWAFPAWEAWVRYVEIAIGVVQLVAAGILAYHADKRGPYSH
jgi:hypothetical protein